MGMRYRFWLTFVLCLVFSLAQAREKPRPTTRPAKKQKTHKKKKKKISRRDLEVIRNMRLLQNLWLLDVLDLFTAVRKK